MLWIIMHAPPQPSDEHLYCDVCESWKRRTYRVPPSFNQAGLIARPSYRACHDCVMRHFDGDGADLIRWTSEMKATEEAHLSLITDEQVERKIDELAGAVVKRVNMPGFRPGHAPKHMIRERYGTVIVLAAMEELLIASLVAAGKPNVDHHASSAAPPKEAESCHTHL
ncbi:MAG: trigger factor family protein [Methanophagales archaeon]|nr:trigger factor family protein [Methanophagales archaeon]